MHDVSDLLELAKSVAVNAGSSILGETEQELREFVFNHDHGKEIKASADKILEQYILRQLVPTGLSILTEESGYLPNKKDSKYHFIVDPLDGTSDFVSKSGEFTIMIALVEKHEPILGVIYWPTNDILYVAQKGGGAHKFVTGVWEKLTISKRSEPHNCRALGSRHHLSSQEINFLKLLNVEKFSERGSSLKVIDVCSGTAELYFTMTNKIKQWDTCASNCLIVEAGGKMTDMLGNELEYNTENIYHKNGILVTNGIIHNIITDRYNEFLRKMKNDDLSELK